MVRLALIHNYVSDVGGFPVRERWCGRF